MTTPDRCAYEFTQYHTSHGGAETCDVCISSHYMSDDGECKEKPEGVETGTTGVCMDGTSSSPHMHFNPH